MSNQLTWPSCSIDWASTGAMIQAVASIIAIVLAGWAGWQAKRAANAAWQTLEEQKHRDLAAQASQVFTSSLIHNQNANRLHEPFLTVHNASALPVYELTVFILDRTTGQAERFYEPSLMPGKEKVRYVSHHVLTSKWGWTEYTQSQERFYKTPEGHEWLGFSVSMYFRDAGGNCWKRDDQGGLDRIDESTMPT